MDCHARAHQGASGVAIPSTATVGLDDATTASGLASTSDRAAGALLQGAMSQTMVAMAPMFIAMTQA